MQKYLFILLFLVFSCDEPVIEGCTTSTACNYSVDADKDDGSCLENDCASECGGDAVEDDCGVCDGIDGYVAGSCYDCADTPNGDAVVDNCGTCDSDTTNDCVQDCADDWGGNLVEDECGVCDGSGIPESDCDCFGNVMDECNICGGTGVPSGDCDCEGNVIDECGDCGGDGSTCATVMDIDENVYQTVQIGGQLWMAENLKVTHYSDSSEITYIINNEDWGSYDEGQYGVYDNDPANADIYGNLYNFAVVDDSRGVCPPGWHVPSDEEYTILTDYLGGESVAGGKMKEAGTEHWNSPNSGATNESGFTGFPAGYRFYSNGFYSSMGFYGYFWSSSEYASYSAWFRALYYHHSSVLRYANDRQEGFSIRCIKD